uniref:DUF4461 domain-containing protein n=1 Tax=Globisporangium ultimum (strain ATCC 200006 / CBS 805.95 / DAOM BR144) TaxID=431595 RepID=K3WEN3_GLOUD
MAKRSTVFKQFLLRVHPDHFRNLPKVHDENLQSIKLLNQFMDAQNSARTSWMIRSASEKQVHFSVFLPVMGGSNAEDSSDIIPTQKVKRFSLELSTRIEARMRAILNECGVVVKESEAEQQADMKKARFTDKRRRKKKPAAASRPWERERDDMDFEASMHDMYEKLRQQEADAAFTSSSRRRKSIMHMKDFLEFVVREQTNVLQQQRFNAWQSTQSVKNTLAREFGIAEIVTSCGWASVHLNATLMVLLKTLRKYTRAQSQGGMFTPSDFLRGAIIDISSQPSGIDFSNEYRIHINPTDVPLQWVEVLEKIDGSMLRYMQSARKSLERLQIGATAALGEAHVLRGNTCSAISYREFLRGMALNRSTAYRGDGVVEKVTLVVEDSNYAWRILANGSVQTPCDSSFDEVTKFLTQNRSRIREQRAHYEAEQSEFKRIAAQCTHALGMKSITYADGIPIEAAITACERLLDFAVRVSMGTADPQKLPPGLYGNRVLAVYTQGRSFCISRSFGLDQDGNFTIPFDWFK